MKYIYIYIHLTGERYWYCATTFTYGFMGRSVVHNVGLVRAIQISSLLDTPTRSFTHCSHIFTHEHETHMVICSVCNHFLPFGTIRKYNSIMVTNTIDFALIYLTQ
jgi:hypothetical protein